MINYSKMFKGVFLALFALIFTAMPGIAYCQGVNGLSESGGGRWAYRANIVLTEPVGLTRLNEPVELTFKSDKVKPQGEDIRITDANNVEIPYQIDVIDDGTYGIYFFAQCTSNSTNTYYLYFGNPNANRPNYGALNSVLDNQNKSWHTDGVFIEWSGRAGYDIPGINVITALKFDNNNDGNTNNDSDCLTDENAWTRAFYGYLGSNLAGIPTGFGSADAQVVRNGPVFCELALGSARIRYFKNQRWIETNRYVDSMFCFDKTYQFMRQGLGSEELIPDWGVRYDDDGTMYWLSGYDSLSVNPGYLALRNPASGLIFGAVAKNVARWSMSVKYTAAWDRQISFDDSSNLPNAKIYWYADTSNSYDGIERFSKQALNPLKVELQVDTEPPSTNLSASPEKPNGANGWYITQPQITLSANENVTTYYTIDNNNLLTYSNPFTVPEGEHKLSYYSIDKFGNAEATKTADFRIDMSLPTQPQLTSPAGNQLTNNPAPTFSWNPAADSGSGLSHYDLYIDGKVAISNLDPSTTCTASPKLNDGPHTWFIRAYDKAGNYIDSTTSSLLVDATPPATNALVSPASPDGDNGWYVSQPSINLSVNETSTIYYRLDSNAFAKYDSTITVPEGIHEISYYAVDLAGNKEQEKTVKLSVDCSNPNVEANISPQRTNNHYLVGEGIAFSHSATDLVSGVGSISATVDDIPVLNGQTISFSKPGEHTFTVTAVDMAGNKTAKTIAFTVGYNFSWLPPIKNKQSSDGTVYNINRNSTVPVKFSVSDCTGTFISNTSVRVTISDGVNLAAFEYGEGKGYVKINAADTNYLLNLHLKDYPWIKSGAVYTISVYFAGDNSSPGMLAGEIKLSVIENGRKPGKRQSS